MALSKTQRRALTRALEVAEAGPSLTVRPGAADATDEVKRWAQTWIASRIRAVLENDAGELDVRELERWAR